MTFTGIFCFRPIQDFFFLSFFCSVSDEREQGIFFFRVGAGSNSTLIRIRIRKWIKIGSLKFQFDFWKTNEKSKFAKFKVPLARRVYRNLNQQPTLVSYSEKQKSHRREIKQNILDFRLHLFNCFLSFPPLLAIKESPAKPHFFSLVSFRLSSSLAA